MQKKNQFYILVLAMVAISILFRLINGAGLEQTSLLFIGLPAILAIWIVRYSDKPKSSYWAVFRAISLFLLIAAVLLGEGVICVLIAAPIFYAVGAMIVFILSKINKDREDTDDPLDSGMFALGFFLILMVSGLYGDVQQKPLQEVTVVKSVSAEVDLNALGKEVDLLDDLPSFFDLGFPMPISMDGVGVAPGDSRKIHFKSTTKGVGVLHLEIVERTNEKIVFKTISDGSHIKHWLSWDTVTVSLDKLPNGQTQIKWTTSFQCELGPAWYFVPIERYAVQLSSMHLVNTYF